MAPQKTAILIFTGPSELAPNIEVAEVRMEELLEEGKYARAVSVVLLEDGTPLGLEVHPPVIHSFTPSGDL